jgi:hypothetical protein
LPDFVSGDEIGNATEFVGSHFVTCGRSFDHDVRVRSWVELLELRLEAVNAVEVLVVVVIVFFGEVITREEVEHIAVPMAVEATGNEEGLKLLIAKERGGQFR